MKRLHAAFATLLLAFAPQLFAQSADEAAVGRGIEALNNAIIAADKAQLEKVSWPELTFGHSSGRIETQAQYVESYVTKKSIVTKIDMSKMTTSIVGDLAIVRGHNFYMVESTGKPVPTELEVVMVWQKRGGEWKLLVRQAFKI